MRTGCVFLKSRAEARFRIREAMAAARTGEWGCLLCGVPVATVGVFLTTAGFREQMGDLPRRDLWVVRHLYGTGRPSGSGHSAGTARRIEESLHLLMGSEGVGTEAQASVPLE